VIEKMATRSQPVTDKTNKITWHNGYISAESFVRTWQKSDCLVDFQRHVARALKESGSLNWDIDNAKEGLTKITLRLNALKQKDLESPLLLEKDVAALNGTKYQPYRWCTGRIVDLKEHTKDLEDAVARTAKRVVKAQRILDNPEDVAYYAGRGHEVQSSSTLQSRATRYRDKGVKLKYLTYNNEPPARCRWEVLSELADELAAAA
jgi:hypothetical protein